MPGHTVQEFLVFQDLITIISLDLTSIINLLEQSP
jgi:hypothetical protein